MLSKETRAVVLDLHQKKGFGIRKIAKALEISRKKVREILESQSPEVSFQSRPLLLEPHLETVRSLYLSCKGNVSRVAEELCEKLQRPVPYSTVTRFCRQHKFGHPDPSPDPAGEYLTGPGVEMQHDTSPMDFCVGGVTRLYQAASLKLCFCRERYLRFYRHFTRFECKDFLTRAFVFFEGLCARCIIDNSSVIVASGSGDDAIIAPEMVTFEKRYLFRFKAHAKGDANRSAKVERDFDFIQRNFIPGRSFSDDEDLNRQAVQWCVKKNAQYNRKAGFVPHERFEQEKVHLLELPAYVPPVYQLHRRRVDSCGLVALGSNEYSAPSEVLGKELTLRETMDTVTLLDGPRELCVHPRLPDGARSRSRLPAHERRTRPRKPASRPQPEELWLKAQPEPLPSYLEGLRALGFRRFVYQVRTLYRLCHEYDPAELTRAIERARTYGLFDAHRLEKILLQELGARLFGPPRLAVCPLTAKPPASSHGEVTPLGPRPQASPQPPLRASCRPGPNNPEPAEPLSPTINLLKEGDPDV